MPYSVKKRSIILLSVHLLLIVVMMNNATYVYATIPQLQNINIINSFLNHSFSYSSIISSMDTVLSAFTKEGYNFNEIGAFSSSSVQDNNNDCNSSAANLIISGKVSDIKNVRYTEILAKEHDPKWMQAVVEVEDIEKSNNSPNIPQVIVFFPNSTDVAWKDSPKLFIGEKATFILHMNPIPELKGEEHYAVVCPSDVQLRS
jgi:hypothetical protein